MRRSIFLFTAVAMFIILAAAPSKAAKQREYQPDANAPRASVPEIYKWNLKDLFKGDSAWHAAFKDVEKRISDLSAYKDKIDNAADLKKCLDAYFDTKLRLQRVSLYANLKVVEDEEMEKYQKFFQMSQMLSKNFNVETSFLREKILRISEENAKQIMSDKELAFYKDYIEELRRRRSRLLGDEAELILGLSGDNLLAPTAPESDIEMIFKAILRDIKLPKIKDEDGGEVQLTLSNYGKYRASKDREVRRETVEGFFKALKDYQNIFAAALAGEVKRDVFFAKARKYDRAVDAYLDVENVDPAVMDNLIRTVHDNLKPLHRYVNLRRQILEIPDVHIYDLYTPIVKSVDTDIPYMDGTAMIIEALRPLGDNYIDTLSAALAPGSGWMDVYPSKGKESGAFSASLWGVHPFNKLNYMNKIDDVSTAAHELGHAMHSYLNSKAQPYFLSDYTTFTAEIASTFNETLLSECLLDKFKNDDAMQMYLLGEMLENIRTTIYRQTLFAEFERKIHEYAEKNTPLTAKLFNDTYIALIKKYYGPGLTIGKDDDVEWAYIPHFYYKYYVYAYATGLSSGIALAQKTLREGAPARDKYLNMLKAPVTSPPLEILKDAGLDLTKPESIKAAADLMNRTITEIEKILAKKK